jgi:hypothetical protein
VQRCRRALAPDHPTTLMAVTGLTLALARLGEAKAARALGRDALQRSRRALGADNPVTLYLTQAASSGQLQLRDDAAEDHPSQPL